MKEDKKTKIKAEKENKKNKTEKLDKKQKVKKEKPENVTYNSDTGLLFCITKRLLGNNDVAEIFNAWSLPENKEANNAYVTLKDVRKTLREEGKLD